MGIRKFEMLHNEDGVVFSSSLLCFPFSQDTFIFLFACLNVEGSWIHCAHEYGNQKLC